MGTATEGLGRPGPVRRHRGRTGVTRRRARTRRDLVDAAYAVFAETGIQEASIERICEEAGYTRGAFYSNFASKEDLFLATYEVQTARRADRLRTAMDTALADLGGARRGQPLEVARRVARLFVESLHDDLAWYLVTAEFRARAMRRPDLHGATLAAEAAFVNTLAELVARFAEQAGISLRLTAPEVAIFLSRLYETVLERALLRDEPVTDPEALAEAIARVFRIVIGGPSESDR